MKGRIEIEVAGEVLTLRVGTLALSRIETAFGEPALSVFESLDEKNPKLFTYLLKVAGFVIEGAPRNEAALADIIDGYGIGAFLAAIAESVHAGLPAPAPMDGAEADGDPGNERRQA